MKTFTLSVLMAAAQAIQLKDDEPPTCVTMEVADDIDQQCNDPDNVDSVFIDSMEEEYDCDIAVDIPVCSES
jgi:hypothetical protein